MATSKTILRLTILKSFFEPQFSKHFQKLPFPIRKKALKAFKSFEEQDQLHFSCGLDFKQIKGTLHRIRIDDNYRALGHKLGSEVQWYWIGLHDEYERRIRQ